MRPRRDAAGLKLSSEFMEVKTELVWTALACSKICRPTRRLMGIVVLMDWPQSRVKFHVSGPTGATLCANHSSLSPEELWPSHTEQDCKVWIVRHLVQSCQARKHAE